MTITQQRDRSASDDRAHLSRLHQILSTGDRAAWTTAALALVAGEPDGGSRDVPGARRDRRVAARSVLDSLGIPSELLEGGSVDRHGVAAQAAAPLLQASAVLGSGAEVWLDQPDEAILAQGRASAQGAAAFAELGLPMLAGLADLLTTPGARMLDVGTGVAALAAGYAELFPELTVVGIDVLPRVLELAERLLESSPVGDRVVLRRQDVAELADDACFALAWLPAPFVPEAALRAGVPRVVRALVPGGWVTMGHGKLGDDPVDEALTRFKTVCYGGTPLNDEEAQRLLREAGLVDVTTVPTPPHAPAVTIGRRPTD
ncbi:SAM-dependent methyltransferase [Nocardioides cynanchi]|uniref:SAM-dependent methyltransferase n=1 Tax=Nocardioides cynanchi TaxID=2558918 RepID=UPI0012487072|nr:class I SAM-dependent methyltransferase [Nocardioides cynanchi]